MAKLCCVNINELDLEECSFLSTARQKKAGSYRLEKDKKLCLAAGVALDRLLKDLGLREKDVNVVYLELGKPYIEGHPKIRFNISHSGDMAIAVISSKEVGCDIERRGRYSEAILSRCFCEDERIYVSSSADPDLAFTRIWTAKESFLKALGLGINAKLNEVAISFNEGGIHVKQKLDPRGWIFQERVLDGYVLSICEEE